jgi:hypothetical protein
MTITVSAATFPGIRPGEACWHAAADGPHRVLLRRYTDAGYARVSRIGSSGQWLTREIVVLPRDLFDSFGAAVVAYGNLRQEQKQRRDRRRFVGAVPGTNATIRSKPGRPSKGAAP